MVAPTQAIETTNDTQSIFQQVQGCPPDPIFQLSLMYNKDTNPNKINLGIGAYRDSNARPWVLPSVRAAKMVIANDPEDDHEYGPIAGRPAFRALAARTIFGADSPAIREGRIASNQTISGSGAHHLAGLFLKSLYPDANLYVSNPTWGNHPALYRAVGYRKLPEYPYWDAATKSLDIDGMLESLQAAPEGSIILLHACAHNPTGLDPTRDQWMQILNVMQKRHLIPLFDSAYQGFASGDLDADAWAVRLFIDAGMELLVAQSFSKNLGLYGERCGCLHVVSKDSATASRVASQLADFTRSEISCTPSFGAKVAEHVLGDDALMAQWRDQDLPEMAGRIIQMRQALHAALLALQTPGTWDYIVTQIGMFSYTGLSKAQCERLIADHSVYLVTNGRISIAGITPSNVTHLAKAIDSVVRS